MFESKYFVTDVLEADLDQDQLFQFWAIQEAELLDNEAIFHSQFVPAIRL